MQPAPPPPPALPKGPFPPSLGSPEVGLAPPPPGPLLLRGPVVVVLRPCPAQTPRLPQRFWGSPPSCVGPSDDAPSPPPPQGSGCHWGSTPRSCAAGRASHSHPHPPPPPPPTGHTLPSPSGPPLNGSGKALQKHRRPPARFSHGPTHRPFLFPPSSAGRSAPGRSAPSRWTGLVRASAMRTRPTPAALMEAALSCPGRVHGRGLLPSAGGALRFGFSRRGGLSFWGGPGCWMSPSGPCAAAFSAANHDPCKAMVWERGGGGESGMVLELAVCMESRRLGFLTHRRDKFRPEHGPLFLIRRHHV